MIDRRGKIEWRLNNMEKIQFEKKYYLSINLQIFWERSSQKIED
jgi:hypothetical protein